MSNNCKIEVVEDEADAKQSSTFSMSNPSFTSGTTSFSSIDDLLSQVSIEHAALNEERTPFKSFYKARVWMVRTTVIRNGISSMDMPSCTYSLSLSLNAI